MSYGGNFNKYFHKMVLKLSLNYWKIPFKQVKPQFTTGTKKPKIQQFRSQPTDTPTVINIIKNLKNTSSYIVDYIPYKYKKDVKEIIAPYITIIVNT